MNTPSVSGLVFMTARNCEAYVVDGLRSLARQSHADFRVLFVDDASTDATAARAASALNELFPGRHELVRNTQAFGKARNAHEHLRRQQGAEFIAILDADDQLSDDAVLADMARAYALGCDVVWSNYRTDRGRLGANGPLDPFRSPRGQGWRSSHFFSFRKCLFDAVPAAYLQDEQGQWLTAACDFAIAYPVLDQTRRYHFIARPAYRYTETNLASHHNADPESRGLNSRIQQKNAHLVLAKPPLPCTRFAAEVPAVQDAALGLQFAQLNDKLARTLEAVTRLQETAAAAPFVQQALEALTVKEQVPLAWLRDAGGWALDVGLLHHLAGTLDGYKQPRVLEFGSGRGSKVLARLCANRGGSLVSVEHDPKWHRHTSDAIERAGLGAHARVRLCPLQDVDFMSVPGRFYDMSWLTAQDVFDVVVVDGPPAKTCKLARLPALPSVSTHLAKTGFHVFLDDYEREEEKQIVEFWRALAPEMRYETLTFGKGVCEISS